MNDALRSGMVIDFFSFGSMPRHLRTAFAREIDIMISGVMVICSLTLSVTYIVSLVFEMRSERP